MASSDNLRRTTINDGEHMKHLNRNRELYLLYSGIFAETFKQPLRKFWCNVNGFDIVRFHKELFDGKLDLLGETLIKYGHAGYQLLQRLSDVTITVKQLEVVGDMRPLPQKKHAEPGERGAKAGPFKNGVQIMLTSDSEVIHYWDGKRNIATQDRKHASIYPSKGLARQDVRTNDITKSWTVQITGAPQR